MRRLLCFSLLSSVACALPAAGQVRPGSDVFLARLSIKEGVPALGTPTNVTHRAGYDNQPSFTPDGRSMLFTSAREDGQTDIYRYDLAARTTSRVTATPESEYSATVMPGGKRISVVRVERDSAQRLWSFALDGSDPRVVIESLKPVGYHAWIDANTLVLFVLGSPNALVRADLRSGRLDTVARGVGRSLARVPGGNASSFSFTQNAGDKTLLREMPAASAEARDLVALPAGSQDIVWLSHDAALAGSGTTVLFWQRGTSEWRTIADLSGAGVRQISRLAVSPDGRWLAFVADDQ